MSLGLVGRKVGMTRIFTDDGTAIPVTVLDVSNNRVTQIKTPDSDGYSAVQVAYGTRRASRVAKAQAGHYAKAGVEAGSVLSEFTAPPEKLAELKVGAVLSVEMFTVGQKVDVSGATSPKNPRLTTASASSPTPRATANPTPTPMTPTPRRTSGTSSAKRTNCRRSSMP